jgi:hypothetical protein
LPPQSSDYDRIVSTTFRDFAKTLLQRFPVRARMGSRARLF